MGILADLFVSDSNDAENYQADLLEYGKPPADKFEYFQSKGMHGLYFEMLWAILVDEEFDHGRHNIPLFAHSESYESLTFRFPDPLVSLLASIDEEAATRAGIEWAKTEELSCRPEDLAPLIAAIRNLALSAQTRGRGMYLWNSV